MSLKYVRDENPEHFDYIIRNRSIVEYYDWETQTHYFGLKPSTRRDILGLPSPQGFTLSELSKMTEKNPIGHIKQVRKGTPYPFPEGSLLKCRR